MAGDLGHSSAAETHVGHGNKSEFGKGSNWEIFEGGSYLICVFKGLLGVL